MVFIKDAAGRLSIGVLHPTTALDHPVSVGLRLASYAVHHLEDVEAQHFSSSHRRPTTATSAWHAGRSGRVADLAWQSVRSPAPWHHAAAHVLPRVLADVCWHVLVRGSIPATPTLLRACVL